MNLHKQSYLLCFDTCNTESKVISIYKVRIVKTCQNSQKHTSLRIAGPGGQNLSWVSTSSLPLLGPPQLPYGVKIRFSTLSFILVSFPTLGCKTKYSFVDGVLLHFPHKYLLKSLKHQYLKNNVVFKLIFSLKGACCRTQELCDPK